MALNMSKVQQILEFTRDRGVIKAKDIAGRGIHREYIRLLEQQGLLIRSGRGIYTPSDAKLTQHHTLVETARRVSHGIVCLLSALSFYKLTSQAPFEVWMAIDQKARRPKENIIPLRIVYMSGRGLEAGIVEHQIEGVTVRVYCPAKTIADCFKFRNKIGLDVAIEALRECWQERSCTMDELWYYAKVCRVQNVMRPYLEML
jgi:predicted transcriptional regulator of viral defense system